MAMDVRDSDRNRLERARTDDLGTLKPSPKTARDEVCARSARRLVGAMKFFDDE